MNSNNLELAQNKLILLYIIKNSNGEFNDEQLTKFILEINLFNFFYFKQYIAELSESEFIFLDNEENYNVTNEGLNTLNMFVNELPTTILEEIDTYLNTFKKDLISKKSIIAKYYKDDFDRIYVNLAIKESNVEIFNLTLEVPTKEYAKKITEKFKIQPEVLYLKIIEQLDI
ncbi:DUF4364 family protein [Anaerosphaera multitolerans]|uniref:DUF4364 family protein n=1 Tax=Anaerosphaera multitolerans TaxID=2487351 RepID=UPI0013E37788|nr:DUF4364 family protein [Anaerosphaera multitolerans]